MANDSRKTPQITENQEQRKSVDLLPQFFRTKANEKFLQATLDQLVQPGVVEKINGYFGRKTAKSFTSSDTYIPDYISSRENYQFEPAIVLRDDLENVKFYSDYNDYMNQLSNFGVDTSDHSKINSQDSYAWDPHIDFDKFVNFREYYWLPNGPVAVSVFGQKQSITSTYNVSVVDDGDNVAYVFDGVGERNPTLQLYRGQTYRFEINTPGYPIAFAITRNFITGNSVYVSSKDQIKPGLFSGSIDPEIYSYGEFITLPENGGFIFEQNLNVSSLFPDGIRVVGEPGEDIANLYVERGVIEFTIPYNAPDTLYYISQTNIDTSGLIKIGDIEENTFLNVQDDILGKKNYTSANGVEFTNGLKVSFIGNIEPSEYAQDYYYVEGVGESITLVPEKNLTIPSAYSEDRLIPYDSDPFDRLPYSNASAYAAEQDYLIINRASPDRNPWSRYNKWFHRDVIQKSFEYNELEVNIDESARAKRPIIEFEAGLKLFNYGTQAKQDVDLVDTFTRDVFSTIEGTIGYNVDGVDLAQGMRVLFAADDDILVNGKIYTVNFITLSGARQISLIPTEDTEPLENQTVFVKKGNKNSGKTYYYDGNVWKLSQEKTQTNQEPLFDLCCPLGNFYGNLNVFDSSSFTGTKIFSYSRGSGRDDPVLGFPLDYRSIENSGDIVFEFNLLTDQFTVQTDSGVIAVNTKTGNLRKYSNRTDFDFVNGYSSIPNKSVQKVLRQYTATRSQTNRFEIDVYDDAGDLNQLKTYVYINNRFVQRDLYDIDRVNRRAFINFATDLEIGDNVLIKTTSEAVKNHNGLYEFPSNLEKNPLNENFSTFTLGEVTDHVESIVEDLQDFDGTYPGYSNIRDLGYVKNLGKRFVKHTGPISLSAYHITNRDYNVIKAIEYSKNEYSKFKRLFIEKATTLGFDGPVRNHVDRILLDLNRDKSRDKPFYFSDMLGYNTGKVIEYTVTDQDSQYYSISEIFDLQQLSNKSVNVYLNGRQLLHGKDYTFNEEGFVLLDARQKVGDNLIIVEYENTDASYIPPTPTKLGLYPKYVPELIIDDTYVTGEPENTGPYKIYAEPEDSDPDSGVFGWIYPVYTSKTAAQDADLNNQSRNIIVKGLGRILYAPASSVVFGAQDNENYTEYPVGYSLIRGHDGSFIRAYKDYRDNLLIEYEKRVYNNIKIEFNDEIFDYSEFIPGKFRNTDFSKQQIDAVLVKDFSQWLKYVDNDYTVNDFYDRDNRFTFNYSNMTSDLDGQLLPGFWRAIYKDLYDTDCPHSRPWEMLGFSIKPEWWEQSYGPAPYTSNNLVLWQDLEQGIVRQPDTDIQIKAKYARPGLMQYIPVDHQGRLRSPVDTGYAKNFFFRYTNQNFSFGDHAPVENAWRRSSEYPFALLRARMLHQPAKIFGMGYDTSRIQKNLAGQYVYSENLEHIRPSEIVFPNTYQDNARVNSSGLVNYLYNLVASDILKVYQDYKDSVNSIQVQAGIKLGGFTDKSKLRFVLDSRSPAQSENGGVFVPEENYQIFLNTSSPLQVVSYSGVIIEKTAAGYVVRGYNDENPVFYYKSFVQTGSDPVISVGGISEQTVLWDEEKSYFKGQLVEYQNNFYRVTENFTSGNQFSLENLAQVPEIPIVGGKRAIFRRRWDLRKTNMLPYGSLLATTQDVVDFLLGYEQYLLEQGFEFEYFNNGTEFIENWDLSAREFLFWTTQNWAQGTTITLSPGAQELKFKRDYSVVDNIFDEFYDYSVLKTDGLPLAKKLTNILRNGNNFEISSTNTTDGIYNVRLPLVQKEHVVVFDNKTVFDDIIYQPTTGYKQDRIKAVGYRSDNWNGSLDIPGFFYDDATVEQWESYRDYATGELVKYKEFYYVATENISGTENFSETGWYRLNEKPESKLYANFDYKINQFADFYDLDTDNYDSEQQRLAQHLTGYQKRKYLENIINDDVSQYKFYQGFLQDKGTLNAIEKLFGKLSLDNENGLELYEEWAIQLGQYGSVDNAKSVEYVIDEQSFLETPQSFELIQSPTQDVPDKVYSILPYEVYDKPEDYDHKPFPTTNLKKFTIDSGYVNVDDIQETLANRQTMELSTVSQIANGEYVWLLDSGANDWNVYQQVPTPLRVVSLQTVDTVSENNQISYEITTDRWAESSFQAGNFLSIRDAQEFNLDGIYQVTGVNSNKITIKISDTIDVDEIQENQNTSQQLTRFRSVRASDITDANVVIENNLTDQQKIWIDNYIDGDWAVLQNQPVFSLYKTLSSSADNADESHKYSEKMVATKDNRSLFVSAPGNNDGIVYYYRRTNETIDFLEQNPIQPPENLFNGDSIRFGESIAVSEDGKYLAIGIPGASEVLTRYRGDFDENTTYNKNDIVKFKESLWQANREILASVGNQSFDSFSSYTDIVGELSDDSAEINLLFAGNPGLSGTVTDHVLVRAPLEQYLGSKSGDKIVLAWNEYTDANGTRERVLPWNGTIPELTANFIEQTHTIKNKIDKILFVSSFVTIPQVGQIVKTDTGIGTVRYVNVNDTDLIMYINDVNGIFEYTNDISTQDDQYIGFYTEANTANVSDTLGGFWFIETGFDYDNGNSQSENGNGLVYVDFILSEQTKTPATYVNITDRFAGGTVVGNLRETGSMITHLSYRGEPGPGDVTDFFKSDLFVIRAPSDYTDNLTVSDNFNFSLYDLSDRSYEPVDYGFNFSVTNRELEVYDLWDGYIDFEFSRFDFSGFPYEPQVGDVLQDVQTALDSFGQLSSTSTSTSTAEVVFYQRNFNSVRVFVKIISGNWNILNNTARYEIRRKANPSLRGSSDVDRVIGQVDDYTNSVILPNGSIGKFIVVQNTVTTPDGTVLFPIVDDPMIVNQEYYFYENRTVSGAFREANPPYSQNLDYTQIYNIPADEFGSPSYINHSTTIKDEGAVAVYHRKSNGEYDLKTVLTSEYRSNNRGFGRNIKISKNNNLYTLFVGSLGDDDSSRTQPGSIEIFKHGFTVDQNYAGFWKQDNTYSRGDIVEYFGDYYRAKADIVIQSDFSILDKSLWEKTSWKVGKDEKYRGIFDNSLPYSIGDVVYNPDEDSASAVSRLYRATTNIGVGNDGPTNSNKWQVVTDGLDYLGYLPNLTNNIFYDYEPFDKDSTYVSGDLVEYQGSIYSATQDILPSAIQSERGFDFNQWMMLEDAIDEQVFDPAENIDIFSRDFDISDDGQVLVVSSKQFSNDSTLPLSKVLVYRLSTDKYILTQIIEGPGINLGDSQFGESVRINNSGNAIAITDKITSVNSQNQGNVYIYRQENGLYQLSQTLKSPELEDEEMFGDSIEFSENYLIVSSKHGDMQLPTTFDSGIDTTFDSGFTTFRRNKKDTGQVYVYENVNNYYLFSESLRYDDAIIDFGENLYCQENHIYVGLPRIFTDNIVGTVLDFRKNKNAVSWTKIRELVRPVDVAKMRKCFLYNRETNQLITEIDVIDPIQGKIAAPAEQNLSYKTAFDPAYYNVSNEQVDSEIFWGKEQVGKLWWDLSTVRFRYPYQGNIKYQKENWNLVQQGTSVNVYEWVESDVLPEEWNRLSENNQNTVSGFSGTSLYGNDRYSVNYVYDVETKTFSPRYYYWVENKRTIPNVENRTLSAFDVSRLISAPRLQGYRYLSMLSDNKFVLNNCEDLIYNNKTVVHIGYTIDENQEKNIHSQYQILSDGLDTSIPEQRIETKWIDSLIGFDEQNRPVPAQELTVKQRYGIQDKPRQSMFVNRYEALKQVIERINSVFETQIILDNYDISDLDSSEQVPLFVDGLYDVEVDTYQEIDFVSTNKIRQATLTPIVENGRITRVAIVDGGRGYKVAPSYVIAGSGSGAEISFDINNLGEITQCQVIDGGKNYTQDTRILVRNFAVLVKNDENLRNRWSIYQRDQLNSGWDLTKVQSYNVNLYWEYVDWYADGYNEFTEIDYTVESSYQLFGLGDSIGDVVKINAVGTGGWLLLEKTDNQDTEDYTVNYKTIGRQNGTIKFLDSLYDYSENLIGYDNRSYDSYFYDSTPSLELRIILNAVKNKLFTGSLRVEYNKLFISSLRYVLNEQKYVDWLFKTSFIKVKHNLGQLDQDITFDSDKIDDYQSYVSEVKPYKTVIREFINGYNSLENSGTSVTDFDLAPWYREQQGKILPSGITIQDNQLSNVESKVNEYPRRHWLENYGYGVSEIIIGDAGSGYTLPPKVQISGGGGTGATAVAYLGYGKITHIKVTNPGSGYTSSPVISLEGSISDGGSFARATAVLGPSRVRKPSISIKFDRVSGTYQFDTLDTVESFTGTGANYVYDLEWPVDTDLTKISVLVDGIQKLRSEYSYENIQNNQAGYTRNQGRITFTRPPALDSQIVVSYQKNIQMLTAADRIRFGYNPLNDMLGADLSQLMSGIDYGGVEVTSFDFGGKTGWDTDGWYSSTWDTFDSSYTDIVFTFDGSSTAVVFDQPLEQDTIYNVYLNNTRIDDPYYGTSQQTNENAVLSTLTGDGSTAFLDLDEAGIRVQENDVLIVRKIESDGSFKPSPQDYDTDLSGGNFQYTTATGLLAEDIIVDGDDFVSATTSGGPEELVPGQIVDTLDIQVETKKQDGQGKIYVQNFVMQSGISTYELQGIPSATDNLIVKINNVILANDEYTIDWDENTVTVETFVDKATLSIITHETGYSQIVDVGNFVSDGSTAEYSVGVEYADGMEVTVFVNGNKRNASVVPEQQTNNSLIRFEQIPEANGYIYYVITKENSDLNTSFVTRDTFVADGSSETFALSRTPFSSIPVEHRIIVKKNNVVLHPGYNIQYVVPDNAQREFALEKFQYPASELLTDDITLYVNGEKLEKSKQWRYNSTESIIVITDQDIVQGDLLEIFVISDSEYSVTNGNLTLKQTPNENDIIEVFGFSEHDIKGIERIKYNVVSRDTLVVGQDEYNTYNKISRGEISLRKTASNVNQIWLNKNGIPLTPSLDYYLTQDKQSVQMVNPPEQNDVIDLIHFSASYTQEAYKFRQFKDMLNRTHYKKIDNSVTTLAQPLNWYDTSIELVDASVLGEPQRSKGNPGVIFIDGERIEYFIKQNNTLKHLRRGTLGTGVKEVYQSGTQVTDQGTSKTIPYKDNTRAQIHTSDGVTGTISLDFVPTSVNDFEVFAAGTRLNKNQITQFNSALALDSPDGDEIKPAGFTWNSVDNTITLEQVPPVDTRVSIVRKTGKIWSQSGKTLAESDTDIGNFLVSGKS